MSGSEQVVDKWWKANWGLLIFWGSAELHTSPENEMATSEMVLPRVGWSATSENGLELTRLLLFLVLLLTILQSKLFLYNKFGINEQAETSWRESMN